MTTSGHRYVHLDSLMRQYVLVCYIPPHVPTCPSTCLYFSSHPDTPRYPQIPLHMPLCDTSLMLYIIIHTHTLLVISLSLSLSLSLSVYLSLSLYIYTYAYVYACLQMCACVCVCVYIYIYVYIHLSISLYVSPGCFRIYSPSGELAHHADAEGRQSTYIKHTSNYNSNTTNDTNINDDNTYNKVRTLIKGRNSPPRPVATLLLNRL